MSYFAHHQPEDKFDVLHSDQSVDGEHEVSGAEVDVIHRVAAKYYRMIIMDSGNNERAVNWRAMIERSQQLVMPCTNVEDTAESGARMLEALANRDDHSRKLAQNAVAIISKRTPGKDPNMDRIVKDFAPLVREVVTIPYDKALVSGVIHFDALKQPHQTRLAVCCSCRSERIVTTMCWYRKCGDTPRRSLSKRTCTTSGSFRAIAFLM